MKFFNWMHNKLNGGQGSRKTNAVPITNQENEEFKDWPDSLLAIGTFGNKSSDFKESQLHVQNDHHQDEIVENSPDLAEFTAEEVGKLQKELTKLLSRKLAANNADDILPLNRFLNCPSSLEVDRRINSSRLSSTNSDNFDHDEEEIDRTIRLIIGRCKDVCNKKNKRKSIGKKSISFLLKKIMFVCASGNFGPAPSLRDTFQESRMEKFLRTMLSKKISPQNASRTSTKRYLEDKHTQKEEQDEKKREKTFNDGCKWVKTDSDFIVLEI